MISFHVKVVPYSILFCLDAISALLLFRIKVESNAFQSVDPDPGPGMQKIHAKRNK